MRKGTRWLLSLLIFYCTSSLATDCFADSYVIFSANPSMPQLSKAKAKMIYMGKSKSIKNIGRVKLLDWPDSSTERAQFYQALVNKSPAQINSQWASLAFSGKAKPPEELSSTDVASIMTWLQANPSGLAYAPANLVPSNAVVVLEVN